MILRLRSQSVGCSSTPPCWGAGPPRHSTLFPLRGALFVAERAPPIWPTRGGPVYRFRTVHSSPGRGGKNTGILFSDFHSDFANFAGTARKVRGTIASLTRLLTSPATSWRKGRFPTTRSLSSRRPWRELPWAAFQRTPSLDHQPLTGHTMRTNLRSGRRLARLAQSGLAVKKSTSGHGGKGAPHWPGIRSRAGPMVECLVDRARSAPPAGTPAGQAPQAAVSRGRLTRITLAQAGAVWPASTTGRTSARRRTRGHRSRWRKRAAPPTVCPLLGPTLAGADRPMSASVMPSNQRPRERHASLRSGFPAAASSRDLAQTHATR